MPKPSPSGDVSGLESQLLRTAAQIIATDGVDALSMRNLGKAAGVSRTAAYYYFADKSALVAKVGEDGFGRLGQAVLSAGMPAPVGLARITAGFAAYLDFALAEPDLYRVMFSDVLDRPLTGEQETLGAFSSRSARRAFALLQAAVGTSPDASDPQALARVHMLWAFAHGIAMLAIGNHLKGITPHALLTDGIARLWSGRNEQDRDKA